MARNETEHEDRWNMAMATLQRIHEFLLNINRTRYTTNDTSFIAENLKALYVESYQYFNETTKAEAQEKYNRMIKEHNNFLQKKRRMKSMTFSSKLDQACMDLDIFLRKVLYDEGLIIQKKTGSHRPFGRDM